MRGVPFKETLLVVPWLDCVKRVEDIVLSKGSSVAESVNTSEGDALYEMGGRPMQNERIVVNVVDECRLLIAIFGPSGLAILGKRFSLMFPVLDHVRLIFSTWNLEVWLNLGRNGP